jgi:hypothetical protein
MTMAQHSQALEREASADRLVPAPVVWAARATLAPGARQDEAVALAPQEALALAAAVPRVARAAEAAQVALAAELAEVALVEAAQPVHPEPAQSTAEGIRTARVPSH